MAVGSTFNLYNTEDQTTNHERLRADWSGNVARIYTQAAGTGTVRGMSIATGTYAGTSGTTTALTVNPTINQSGTAGYTAFDINPTETATGSGTKLLQRWAVGGTTRSEINTSGTYFASNVYCNLTGSIGWSTNSSSSNLDLALNRDAADTLALRRSTNAQIFRVYNTYTDGSNYERLAFAWSSSIATISTDAAGTGTVRSLRLNGSTLSLMSGGAQRWNVNSSGHFLAEADNTYDIGASGANRPRNVYIGGSTVIGAFHTVGVSTVAALPAAAGAARAQIFVSDSSVAAAGNFGAIVVGGGANIVPVFCDGTNWRIG